MMQADHNARMLVIVPAYKEELALPGTIADLRTNRPDVDILVIDDGSPDETSSVSSIRL